MWVSKYIQPIYKNCLKLSLRLKNELTYSSNYKVSHNNIYETENNQDNIIPVTPPTNGN